MLFAARSAVALNRLLDVLPVFSGDHRIERFFVLVPGSAFHAEALAAIEHVRARTLPWEQACRRSFDLIVASNPKGRLGLLRGARVLLPHGAGFSKTVRGEGSPEFASGLDPAYLLHEGGTVAAFHALAHPSQLERLAARVPEAAERAAVVGDPTLERILVSRSHRERYRHILGTGARRLVVVASTWGPESLFMRRPTLPAELATRLPYDEYQTALALHPNARSEIGSFELAERLAPALDAGMIFAAPYGEWAALLVAADAVITDHGSTAFYAAALDRPLIGAYDGGDELIPGSPMAELLARSPRLDELSGPEDVHRLDAAIDAHVPGSGPALAAMVFAEQGRALELLRQELYGILGLDPPRRPVEVPVLPPPPPPARTPVAFGVRTSVTGMRVRVERFPAHGDRAGDHLAAEYGAAGERHVQSAGLVYRRPGPPRDAAHRAGWTAAGWTARILADYPGCRTAGAVLSDGRCVARLRGGPLVTIRIEPYRDGAGRVAHPDPAAVLSAVHAWPPARSGRATALTCLIGERAYGVRVSVATDDEATDELPEP